MTDPTRAPAPPPANDIRDDSDAVLSARCNRGDAAAWETLVQRYQRLVYTIVRRVGLDEHMAADVFQTVFMRLMEHLPRLTQQDRLQAWIVTTAKREALLQRSRGLRTVSISADDDDGGSAALDIADDAPLPEDTLAEVQTHHQVRLALDRLDARCRDLLSLLYRDVDEPVSYDDIAATLGMPLGSIGPTRSRCLGKLRTLMEQA
ncbi:MAG: sigma-70 family RNA polymerase sigma factor [Burkholderiales bacterium]|nr:sigma-70 family RNA polymerase sigma factor [Burkholderiales bacterium]